MISFVDYRTSLDEINSLKNMNYDVIKVPRANNLYSAIDGHVDIQFNILSKKNKTIIINKDINNDFKKLLDEKGIKYINSFSSLHEKYPNNVLLNAYITENYLIHNLKYSDKELLNYCKNKKHINIKQGYSKCSILPIREDAIITNDAGIHKALVKENFDVLLIPFGDIELPGLNYGFIGGVGGMISDDCMAFFGSLEHYAFGTMVKEFLYKYDIKPLYLRNSKLFDRGSLLVL